MDIAETVRTLMSNKGCGLLDREKIKDDSILYEVGFDSIRFMELVVILEEQFNTQFPDEYLELSEKTKVSDIMDAVHLERKRSTEYSLRCKLIKTIVCYSIKKRL